MIKIVVARWSCPVPVPRVRISLCKHDEDKNIVMLVRWFGRFVPGGMHYLYPMVVMVVVVVVVVEKWCGCGSIDHTNRYSISVESGRSGERSRVIWDSKMANMMRMVRR